MVGVWQDEVEREELKCLIFNGFTSLWVCWDSGFDELRRWRNRRKKRIKGKRNVCGGPL